MQTVKLHQKLKLQYSESVDGNIDKRFSSGEDYKTNRKNFYKTVGLSQHQIVEGQQTHSDRILRLNLENTKMWRGQLITGVDGFVTNQTDVCLMIRVADCVPLVIYDPDHHAVGLIHAGWRGTTKNIHIKGLERMVKEYQTDPKQCLVWFGPSARANSFYSPESPIQLDDPVWKPYINAKASRWYIDIIGYQIETLKTAGILKKNMTIDPKDTVNDLSLFSHLRTKDTSTPEGRFAVIAKLD
jgi:YfiH family protein